MGLAVGFGVVVGICVGTVLILCKFTGIFGCIGDVVFSQFDKLVSGIEPSIIRKELSSKINTTRLLAFLESRSLSISSGMLYILKIMNTLFSLKFDSELPAG